MIVLVVPVFAMTGALAPPPRKMTYNLYFGDLHTHTAYSDAWEGTPWDAYAAAKASGADFMAVTDHTTLWNAYGNFVLTPETWNDTLAAAAYYTSKNFAALTGYETWMLGKLGEIKVCMGINQHPVQPFQSFWAFQQSLLPCLTIPLPL